MNYELFYRKGIDTSADKKFALLVFVYGAPEYQNVDGLWTTDFVKARVPRTLAPPRVQGLESGRTVMRTLIKAYLPSSYDVVTLLIDGRGSAYEGDNFMHSTYKQLGYIEPIDQIAVTRHVLGR